MKKRPLSIRLLALVFLLSPLGVVAEMLWLYRVPPAQIMYIFIPELWNWQVIGLCVVTPLVGLAVWTVRPWAYQLLLGYSILILLNNVILWVFERSLTGLGERIAMTAVLLFLVVFEIRRQFYAPYFNPRLRWWEQAQRFLTNRIEVRVRQFGSGEELFKATSFDISATGVYLVSEHAVKIGQIYGMEVILPGDEPVHASAEVVWVNPGLDPNPAGFGCRFTTIDGHFKSKLNHAIADLHAAMKTR